MRALVSFKKTEKGAALIWVLILMVFFVTLTSSMLFISRQDIFETVNHRERTKAYYLAESGIDMVYAALMKKTNPSDVPLIKSYQDDTDKEYEQQIMIGSDTVDIRIESVEVDGKWWVKVTSTGEVADSGAIETTSLRIYQPNQVRFGSNFFVGFLGDQPNQVRFGSNFFMGFLGH